MAKPVYHLKKRPEDGKWEVLKQGGEKAIKLFKVIRVKIINDQQHVINYKKKGLDNEKIIIYSNCHGCFQFEYNGTE